MTIRDIVRSSALILGKNDVITYLDGGQNTGIDTFESVNLLTNLCTLVIDELSATYIPLIKKETVTFSKGKHALINFSQKVVKMIGVYDMDGNSVDFSVDGIYVTADISKCIVEYEYAPKNYGLEDKIGYSEKDISLSALAYGVAAEYCITQGLFEQAVMHHKRFVDIVAEACVPKNKMIKSRSWV